MQTCDISYLRSTPQWIETEKYPRWAFLQAKRCISVGVFYVVHGRNVQKPAIRARYDDA